MKGRKVGEATVSHNTITTIQYDLPEVPKEFHDEFDKLISDTNNLYFKLEDKGIKDAEKVLMQGTSIKIKYVGE